MSLLQPQRETYNLFDDVMLLAEGQWSLMRLPHIVAGAHQGVWVHGTSLLSKWDNIGTCLGRATGVPWA
jgi:hypothetical protein